MHFYTSVHLQDENNSRAAKSIRLSSKLCKTSCFKAVEICGTHFEQRPTRARFIDISYGLIAANVTPVFLSFLFSLLLFAVVDCVPSRLPLEFARDRNYSTNKLTDTFIEYRRINRKLREILIS